MNENFKDLLADNSEILLDSLMDNEILKEIPVLGSSLKIIRGIQSIRDKSYLNKVKRFLEHLGEIGEKERKKLIEESVNDKKRRVKFGDAIFTTIEQSDSLVKVEYIAIAFEAFLNDEIKESDLRLICHVINNSFTDESIEVIEADSPNNLQYVVPSGLAEMIYPKLTLDMDTTEPQYKISSIAGQLRTAWKKYRKE
jgi:hypothetical protein